MLKNLNIINLKKKDGSVSINQKKREDRQEI